ncbi:hypothetical protein C8Q78DRAFT_1021044 [Trametes maxima]|nr:hypothetical protein C8Q78DRAFT_1021044 [Trametes maxima]
MRQKHAQEAYKRAQDTFATISQPTWSSSPTVSNQVVPNISTTPLSCQTASTHNRNPTVIDPSPDPEACSHGLATPAPRVSKKRGMYEPPPPIEVARAAFQNRK